jgi:5-methylcytosine-specific restriction protein A
VRFRIPDQTASAEVQRNAVLATMPSRPPSLKPRVARKAWQHSKPSSRLRGRAGVEDRRRILAEEPLCRVCRGAGRVAASVVVDHVMPLSAGGSDERGNKQGLCGPCHDAKSKAERTAGLGAGRKSTGDHLDTDAQPLFLRVRFKLRG